MNARRIIYIYQLHYFNCYLRFLRLILTVYCGFTLNHKAIKERTEYIRFYHGYKCKYCGVTLGPIFIKKEYRHEFDGEYCLNILI